MRLIAPPWRKASRHLALDQNLKLAQDYEEQDELQANQEKIKAWIKEQQQINPELSFRDLWPKCQKAHPEWFESLQSA